MPCGSTFAPGRNHVNACSSCDSKILLEAWGEWRPSYGCSNLRVGSVRLLRRGFYITHPEIGNLAFALVTASSGKMKSYIRCASCAFVEWIARNALVRGNKGIFIYFPGFMVRSKRDCTPHQQTQCPINGQSDRTWKCFPSGSADGLKSSHHLRICPYSSRIRTCEYSASQVRRWPSLF